MCELDRRLPPFTYRRGYGEKDTALQRAFPALIGLRRGKARTELNLGDLLGGFNAILAGAAAGVVDATLRIFDLNQSG